jgi:hypothetical protein
MKDIILFIVDETIALHRYDLTNGFARLALDLRMSRKSDLNQLQPVVQRSLDLRHKGTDEMVLPFAYLRLYC